jgi:hypothetical protein
MITKTEGFHIKELVKLDLTQLLTLETLLRVLINLIVYHRIVQKLSS